MPHPLSSAKLEVVGGGVEPAPAAGQPCTEGESDMKFERAPFPVETENADSSAMMIVGGIAVAAALVLVSAPRLFALLAVVGGTIAGALLAA